MKILTALDHSEYAEIVLQHGLDQAVRNLGAELHFVTIVANERDIEAARAWSGALVRDGLDAFDIRDRLVALHARCGPPAESIAALAAELPADLLVIGRFHVPSESEPIIDMVGCPTLIVGIDGHVLEPQCAACGAVRRETGAEALFCLRHRGDRIPDLTSRLPLAGHMPSRLW